jgi:hypothetical protein
MACLMVANCAAVARPMPFVVPMIKMVLFACIIVSSIGYQNHGISALGSAGYSVSRAGNWL